MTSLGSHFLVDAFDADPAALRDAAKLGAMIESMVAELALHPIAAPILHRFPGEGGVTAVVLLSESHLALHTYPEHRAMTLDLYTCRPRAPYAWAERLRDAVGAREVRVREVVRGEGVR